MIGFKVQLSDWEDCKTSKIAFKLAKCTPKPVLVRSMGEVFEVLISKKWMLVAQFAAADNNLSLARLRPICSK